MRKQITLAALVMFIVVPYARANSCPQAATLVPSLVAMAESLSGDKFDGAKTASGTLAKDLGNLPSQPECILLKDLLKAPVTKFNESKDIKSAREFLKDMNEGVKTLYRETKPSGIDIAWCPMAKVNWLQKSGAIRNPYYGASMLECGMVASKKVLQEKATK